MRKVVLDSELMEQEYQKANMSDPEYFEDVMS